MKQPFHVKVSGLLPTNNHPGGIQLAVFPVPVDGRSAGSAPLPTQVIQPAVKLSPGVTSCVGVN